MRSFSSLTSRHRLSSVVLVHHSHSGGCGAGPIIFSLLIRSLVTMVVLADVDRFLNKSYLKYIFENKLKWPWPSTHFIVRDKCFICGVYSSSFGKPKHLIMDMSNSLTIIWWLQNSTFFCVNCNYLLYDHYPTDECMCADLND